MAEIELHVLNTQCLIIYIPDMETITREAKAWQACRNNNKSQDNWQFTTTESKIKLK